MQEIYIAFDVETPNSANDRMSAIGLTLICNGKITDRFYTLINPETYFSPFNSELTGIYPEDVKGAPTFPEVWAMIENAMSRGTLVAHNAPFDMSVLAKCLRDYGIKWKARVPYLCTCTLSKRTFRELSNHKLNTLCDCLDIQLEHHNAGSDADACAQLLLCCAERGADVRSVIKEYDMLNIKTVPTK